MTYQPPHLPERGTVATAPAPAGLPELDDEYEVPPSAAVEFAASGHTSLRSVASAQEIAAYRPVIEEATRRHSRETRPIEARDTYGKAFLQVPNLWRVDEGVRKYVLARRFGKIAADLMS